MVIVQQISAFIITYTLYILYHDVTLFIFERLNNFFSLFFSDIPRCKLGDTCNEVSATLASDSYLGYLDIYAESIWRITTLAPQYIVLYIDTFDVGCNTGSLFQVELTENTIQSFCNTDKPLNQIVSLDTDMTIKFQSNRISGTLLEQFFGHYKVKAMVETTINIPATFEEGTKVSFYI